MAEELSYYHFHKNPEQIISKDPFHLLTEEIKKNKTGSPSNSVDKEMLKTIISNRIKEKYLGSVMKTFGYTKRALERSFPKALLEDGFTNSTTNTLTRIHKGTEGHSS